MSLLPAINSLYSTLQPPINSDNLPEIELKNESDYIILNNLIELFSVVVESCEFEMLNPSIPSLIKTFVEYARVNPIKGGFFHLLTTVFKKSGSSVKNISTFKDTRKVFSKFLNM